MNTYRYRWALGALALFTCMAMLGSCGSGGGMQLEPVSSTDAAGQESFNGLLPAIDELPEATHEVSMLGPGWYPVDVTEQGVLRQRSASGSVMVQPDGVHITADSAPAWALFAVYGFDHDAFPSSVRVETDADPASYYVGETSYQDGRWNFAGPFGGNAEFEYPEAGTEYDPDNHVNPMGTHYVAIVAQPGVEMVLSGIELGVHGGENAPMANLLLGIDSDSGDQGIVISWPDAAGSDIPDYLGAFVERSLWPSFDFETIAGPVLDNHFLDSTVELGTKYRYRVRYEDVSGNAGLSQSISSVATAGDLPPIAVLDIPHGPLFGRQTVNFDMSGSFDPDGDAITEYRVEFGIGSFNTGIQPVFGPASDFDIELQPGTYWIMAEVTANGKTGGTLAKLKVYPAWQQTASIVSPGQKGEWQMQRNRAIHFPPANEMLVFHDAPLLPGVGLHITAADGSMRTLGIPYMRTGVQWISEPVIHDGRAWIAVRDDNTFFLASYDGNEFRWADNFTIGVGGGYEQCDLVVDGDGRLRMCYLWEFNPGDWRIDAVDVFDYDVIPVSPTANTSGWFDVEWNPVHGTFDVIYPMVGISMFQRLDPIGGPVDNEMVIAIAPSFADLEVDPASGQASVLERIGTLQLYIPYDDGAGMFGPPEIIDNAADNTEFADLAFIDSDPTVFFGLNALPSNLYRRNGGSWDPIKATWAPSSGQHCAIAAWPDETVQIVDGTNNGGIFLASVDASDNTEELDYIEGSVYQGNSLHAVAGSDGLHAYWIIGNEGVHVIGSADGKNWVPAADNGPSFGADLMADRDGEVFLSTSWGANHELHSWTGAAWLFESSSDTFNASQAWFCAQDNVFGGQWWAHDHSVAPARIRRMHDDDGMALLPDSYEFDITNVFEGTGLLTLGGYTSFVLTGNGSEQDGSVGFLDNDTASYSEIIKGFTVSDEISWTNGRQLDACNYIGDPGLPKEAYWASFKSFDLGATRIEGLNFVGDMSIEHVEGFDSLLDTQTFSGALTTVSAAQARSNTAVAVLDQFFGDWHRMEWSNFGDFEEIPSPGIDWSMTSMHELVVGEDGQWHLLYRDMRDGYIYVISTT